jgi:hypothetical protein
MSENEKTEKRKAQLRDAQRRRRELLAGNGGRHQVNIYLSSKVIKLMDAECLLSGTDRHELVERLILSSLDRTHQ